MCALAIQGAAVADATAEYQLRLSAFRFRILFFRSFPSSLPDLIRQSMPKLRSHSASTGVRAA